ncbi:MAG: hypothetical protein JXB47_01855 [Anaerolineae bacterium]|nr:hypothetical protein [Anaerolineae bacterium]
MNPELFYDKESNALYLSIRQPREAISREAGDNVLRSGQNGGSVMSKRHRLRARVKEKRRQKILELERRLELLGVEIWHGEGFPHDDVLSEYQVLELVRFPPSTERWAILWPRTQSKIPNEVLATWMEYINEMWQDLGRPPVYTPEKQEIALAKLGSGYSDSGR